MQPIAPGLAIVQSNFPEQLRQAFLAHVARHPLQPLEDEVVLVQSRGFGRWLELGMAEDPGETPLEGGLGISAAFRSELPARFLWQAYRAVLGEERLPEHSLFDADRLRWLVFRLLGEIAGHAEFEPLHRYLAVERDSAYRRFQLAGEIARLFESYQFYRADWLLDWEAGRDLLRQEGQQPCELPVEQRWQPTLWRELISAASSAGLQHRGRLHADFVAALEDPAASFIGLPRRVSVFGVTSLPEQSLRALAAMSRHVQVLVFLHNPCQYYWGNIIEQRDLHRRWSGRHQSRAGMPDRVLEETEIVDWANPLLSSWGKQGRDFIGLLDRMDRPDAYASWFDGRIDLFADHFEGTHANLLQQLQQGILDLEPSPPAGERTIIPAAEGSVRFIRAHSRQREVEILHDHLLALFAEKDAWQPRDVVVMVPNIDDYAPHIDAVFGQFAALEGHRTADRRFIPYSIGDRVSTDDSMLLRSVESLLGLPSWRMTSNEILDLLQTPAVRARFGLAWADMALVERWLEGAGVRWGLDKQHRDELLDTDDAFSQNTWSFGLNRMMLGYAVGQRLDCEGVVAYDEITAGEARIVACLRELVVQLGKWRKILARPACPGEWEKRIRDLVEAFLVPQGASDALDRYRFDQALVALIENLEHAGVDEVLGLDIVLPALLEQIAHSRTGDRFLVGRVNFCTLMPMRCIPFRVVCLLGMNDGDYPRTRRPVDFDLMDAYPRPGDRSRREDDRYLFLEALLAAREHLYVSWVGRSVRDNAELPPSVLVGQLRDAIAAGWRIEDDVHVQDDPAAPDESEDPGRRLLAQLTIEHPLQPFSREYFRPGQARLRTFAREWADVWQPIQRSPVSEEGDDAGDCLPLVWPTEPVRLAEVVSFYRSPVSSLINERLQTRLTRKGDLGGLEVDEPFELNELEGWSLRDELLGQLMLDDSGDSKQLVLERQLQLLAMEGRLPLGQAGEALAEKLIEEACEIGERFFEALDQYGPQLEKVPVRLCFMLRVADESAPVHIDDWLPPMRGELGGRLARIEVSASKVGTAGAPKWDKVARYWPQHLAACASGLSQRTVIVGSDHDLSIEPVAPDQASAWLRDLMQYWMIARSRPLPVEAATSGDYLKRALRKVDQPESEWLTEELAKVAGVYEGNAFQAGRVERDPNLQRIYPDFQSLLGRDDEDGFRAWSERIYGPMVRFMLTRGAQR